MDAADGAMLDQVAEFRRRSLAASADSFCPLGRAGRRARRFWGNRRLWMGRTVSRYDGAVVMPAYNGAGVIRDALVSAVSSIELSNRSVVVSVVDDASTDGTAAIVSEFAATTSVPLVLGHHRDNCGTGATRNSAIRQVSADRFLFLDQDDTYRSDHIELCMRVLDNDPEIDYVRTAVELERPVHPDWREPIAESLVQTRAVRASAVHLIGGFSEDPAVAIVGCDDVIFTRLLTSFFPGTRLHEETVHWTHRRGNSFDRQLEGKFSRPLEEAIDTLDERRRAALPAVESVAEAAARECARAPSRACGDSGLAIGLSQVIVDPAVTATPAARRGDTPPNRCPEECGPPRPSC